MNLLDLAILILVVLMIGRGISRGIVQEAANLLGVIVSFLVSIMYYKELSSWALRFLPRHQMMLSFFSFVLLFLLTLFAFNFLAILAKKAIRLTFLGWVDRSLGAFFGLIKAAVIIFFLVTMLTVFYPKSGFLVDRSRFFPTVLELTSKLTALIPYKVKTEFLEKKRALQDFWTGKRKTIQRMQRLPVD